MRGVRSSMLAVPGSPFDVVTTPSGEWSFVSFGSSVGVVSNRSFVPRLVRQVPVAGQPMGEALTHDGRELLVADQSGAVVLSVAAAEHGASNAILGVLG